MSRDCSLDTAISSLELNLSLLKLTFLIKRVLQHARHSSEFRSLFKLRLRPWPTHMTLNKFGIGKPQNVWWTYNEQFNKIKNKPRTYYSSKTSKAKTSNLVRISQLQNTSGFNAEVVNKTANISYKNLSVCAVDCATVPWTSKIVNLMLMCTNSKHYMWNVTCGGSFIN